jgi:hypothetical protein
MVMVLGVMSVMWLKLLLLLLVVVVVVVGRRSVASSGLSAKVVAVVLLIHRLMRGLPVGRALRCRRRDELPLRRQGARPAAGGR